MYEKINPLDEKIDTTMPVPWGELPNRGGVFFADFYQVCRVEREGVVGAARDLVDPVSLKKWFENFENNKEIAHSDLKNYVNNYSFICAFNISKEDFTKACQKEFANTNLSDDIVLDEKEIELLYTGTIEEINKYFATDYTIVLGEKVFSPEWVYYHTIEDYKTVGITPEQIKEKIVYYQKLPLIDEAKNAWAKKLSEYIGEPVVLEELKN